MWELALADPHLVRLADWLAHTEGGEHYSRWQLERAYLEEPWMCDLEVITVVHPSYWTVPFVRIWSNKEGPHATCGFAKRGASEHVCLINIFCIHLSFADLTCFWTDLIILN